MARYIDAEIAIKKCNQLIDNADSCSNPFAMEGVRVVRNLILSECETGCPTADVVEVETVSEKIIRKKAEVNEYMLNNVKNYRTMQGYSDVEHEADNFLRGYNEAVEDMLAILDGKLEAEKQ